MGCSLDGECVLTNAATANFALLPTEDPPSNIFFMKVGSLVAFIEGTLVSSADKFDTLANFYFYYRRSHIDDCFTGIMTYCAILSEFEFSSPCSHIGSNY